MKKVDALRVRVSMGLWSSGDKTYLALVPDM
jgi:hypothetical protein